MAEEHRTCPGPAPTAHTLHQLTRRSLLQSLGFGTAAALAGSDGTGGHRSAAAQESSEADPSTIGTREAGGPAIDDVLWDLNFDTEDIFRFVAVEVAYEAYAGALRGAKGTQWGLAGNSVDQALLLAELLTRAQIPVRFAAGDLGARDSPW